MRKVISQMMVSLDGYFEGPNREIDWHTVDEEFNTYAIALLRQVDTLLFGRRTYELMAGYWPGPEAVKDDPVVAGLMNTLNKVVFSRTLTRVEWRNSRIAQRDAIAEIQALKHQEGKDMAIFGSSELITSLLPARVIDELRIIVNPVVLGAGKPFLKGIAQRIPLKLQKATTQRSGNVVLVYEQA